MPRVSVIAAVALLPALLGCGTRIRPFIEQSRTPTTLDGGAYAPARGELPATGRDIGDRGLPTGRPAIAGGRMVGDSRTVCRTDARPSGWIAVAYVAANGNCVARAAGDSVPMAAVLTRYAELPANTELDVCADERVPHGWVPVRTESGDATDSCPGSARDGSTTRRIRRQP